MEQEGRSLFRHLRCLIYKTLFASITGANRLILVLCQSSHLEFSLLLFLISCALRKGTWRSCTLRGFEPVSRKRNGGKAARENYSETALNSSSSKLSGDWVFGYSEFCCSSAFALVNELSEYRKNCILLNAVDRGQFALTH